MKKANNVKNKKYRLGFVGTGAMARYHLLLLKELSKNNKIPKFSLTGCYDSNFGRAEIFSKKNKCPFYKDFSVFISESFPEIVYLCTPPFARVQYETFLIKKRIHYFTEKPPSILGQQTLVNLLQKASLNSNFFIQSGFHLRYYDCITELKSFLKKDPIRMIMVYKIGQLPLDNWRIDKNLCGGSIYETLINVIYLCEIVLNGTFTFQGYFNNKPVLNKITDRNCNLSDAEILIFKINDILCNISVANYLESKYNFEFKDILELKFIGKRKVYNLQFKKSGSTELQVMDTVKSKPIKIFKEKREKGYKEENIVFWKSISENKNLGLVDYIQCLKLANSLKKHL